MTIDFKPVKLLSDSCSLDRYGSSAWCKLLYQTGINEWQVHVYEHASFIPDESFTCANYGAAIDLYLQYNGSSMTIKE